MRKLLIFILIIVIAGGAYYYFGVYKNAARDQLTPYSPGDFFITNIKDSNRLLKTSIVLELSGEELANLFIDNNAAIRDTIIFILRDLTEAEIRDIGVEENIRRRIRSALNDKMQTEGVVEVLFNDFVMQ